MAAYDSYKDSGVKWLGKVPSHWEVKKLRSTFFEVKELNSNRQTSNQLQFKFGTIISKPDCSVDTDVWTTIEKYTVVKPNDIIINGLNLNFDLLSMRVGQVKDLGAITSAYVCLRPKNNIFSSYFLYLLKGMDARKVFHGFGSGIRATLSFKELKNKELAIPPQEEQEAIVAYLDNVTAKIDEAIEAQQKMIDALNERKQIIITRAVTKGLNPDAPLRDSGIDWLGQIPSHWDCCKLKFFIKIKSGEQVSNNKLSDNGKYLVYGGGEPIGYYNNYNVEPNTIIVGRVGARCGCITLTKNKSWATDNALIISHNNIETDYLVFVLTAINLNKLAATNAQPLLTGSKVKNSYISVPPKFEQIEISKYIKFETSKIDDIISTCFDAINLLQERKQIIINEVVTGKKKII